MVDFLHLREVQVEEFFLQGYFLQLLWLFVHEPFRERHQLTDELGRKHFCGLPIGEDPVELIKLVDVVLLVDEGSLEGIHVLDFC